MTHSRKEARSITSYLSFSKSVRSSSLGGKNTPSYRSLCCRPSKLFVSPVFSLMLTFGTSSLTISRASRHTCGDLSRSPSKKSFTLEGGKYRGNRFGPGCTSSSTTQSPSTRGNVKNSIIRRTALDASGNSPSLPRLWCKCENGVARRDVPHMCASRWRHIDDGECAGAIFARTRAPSLRLRPSVMKVRLPVSSH